MNLLIVTLANNSLSGGSVASRSNFEAFRNSGAFNICVLGSSNLSYVTHPCDVTPSTSQKILSYTRLRPAINFAAIMRIINDKGLNDPDVVFFDSSLLGHLAPHLKKRFPDAFFITFFHNIESSTYRSMMNKKSLLAWTRFFSILRAERLATRNSDYRIVLSHSDSAVLAEKLGAHADIIWPITYPSADRVQYENQIDDEYVLFVGGYYKPNLDAIEYLATQIAPRINKRIVVAGYNLGKIQEKYSSTPNLTIINSPENLAPLYQNANLILAPIFTGGGIKTKIIEAFSFGKYVVSSPEAAVGFENISKSCMSIVNCDNDYIKHINSSIPTPPRTEICSVFNKYFSIHAKEILLQKLIDQIGTRRHKTWGES